MFMCVVLFLTCILSTIKCFALCSMKSNHLYIINIEICTMLVVDLSYNICKVIIC